MTRLIISGTREPLSPEDRALVLSILAPYVERAAGIGVGDCPTGVDALVRETWPTALVFAADWLALGRAAGPERNGRMVRWAAEAPHAVLCAFPGPRSRGTWDCVTRARAEGVSVLIKRIGKAGGMAPAAIESIGGDRVG